MSLRRQVRAALREKTLEWRERILATSQVLSFQRPKRAADSPCATCPFTTKDERAFAKIFALAEHPDSPWAWVNKFARPFNWALWKFFPEWTAKVGKRQARDLALRGAFICHHSVYRFDKSGTSVKPESEWRLCKGAETVFR